MRLFQNTQYKYICILNFSQTSYNFNLMGKNEKQQERENLVGKRLAFFLSFLRANFITQKSIPKEIMPFATVNTNVFKDDMRLSAAFRVHGYYGYTLLIYIEPKDALQAQAYRAKCVRVNDMVKRGSQMDRISFLKDFIEINKLMIKDVTSALEIVPSALTHWYNTDDMMISRIYKLAYAFNCNVRFEVVPFVDEEEETGTDVPTSIVEIKSRFSSEIGDSQLYTQWEASKSK